MPDTGVDTSKMTPAALAQYLQGLFAPAQTGASGLLAQIAGPGGIYDPTQDLATAAQKSQLAGTLPTEADIAAQGAERQAKGADYLYRALEGVSTPREGMLEQPNLPQLQLPDQPQAVRPQVSPLAQLLAIGASFASPKSAGQFNAAALEGAIKSSNEENQRRQQRDKVDVARRAMMYDASMSAARERERVTELNRDAAYRNTIATTDKQMLMAKAGAEQLTAANVADSLKAFAEKHDPALKARDEVKALLDQVDLKGKASAERVKSVAELLTAVHKEDTAGTGMAKEVFGQVMTGVHQAAQSRATDARQARHDTATAQAALKRVEVEQAGAARRAAMSENAAMSRLKVEEEGRDRRLQANINRQNKSQSVMQSQQNQKRLQTDLGKIEESLSAAQSNLAVVSGGGAVGGLSGAAGMRAFRAQVDSLFKSREDYAKALRIEQERASTLGGGTTGTFDPATGEVIDE